MIISDTLNHSSSSQGRTNKIFLYTVIVYIFVAIGRTPEVIHILLPLKIGVVASVLMIYIIARSLTDGTVSECYHRYTEAKLLVWLLLIACISMLFSSYHMLGLSFIFSNFVKLVMFYFIIVISMNSPRDVFYVMWGYIISILILGIPSLLSRSADRFSSMDLTYDPNDIALLMVVSLPLVIYFIPHNRRVQKLCLLFTVVVIYFTIIGSSSRGGFLGMVAVLAVMLLRSHFSFAKKIAVVGIVCTLFLIAAPESYKQRMNSMADDDQEYNLTSPFGRKQIWERSLVLFQNNPVFGVGPGCFQVANGFTFTEDVGGYAWNATAHNSFVLIGTEMGAAGLILYVSILVVAARNVRKTYLRAAVTGKHAEIQWMGKAIEASIAGFMVSGFFLSSCYNPISYFLVGLATVYAKLHSKPDDSA
jgi:O-antigen ligase